MAKCEFEFFECTGRVLFAPLNDTARDMCAMMKRKNLTEREIEFYLGQGYELELRARICVKDSLKQFVVGHEVVACK